MIGDVEDFAIEADPPLAKRPGFIRAQVETFIRTEVNQGETKKKPSQGIPSRRKLWRSSARWE